MAEPSNAAKGSSKLRLVILIGVLGLAVFALWYDYKVARPAVERAYDQVTLANNEINNAAEHRRMTSVDVQKVIGRAPDETFVSGDYTVEAYRWSAGMPLEFRGLSAGKSPGVGRKMHTYFALYRPDGPELAFVTHHKFELDEDELNPKPIVAMAGADEGEMDMEMGMGMGGEEGGPDGGSPGGPGGGGGRGGFDPEAMFTERDADGDGKLTGDEISDRMRENLEEIDTDGDGAVSKEELLARMSQRQGRRGGGGERGGRGGEGGERPQRPTLDSTEDETPEPASPAEEQPAPAAEPEAAPVEAPAEPAAEAPATEADTTSSEAKPEDSTDKP